MKKLLSSFLIASLLVPTMVHADNTQSNTTVNINAPSGFLVNTDTGEVLYQKNENQQIPAASLTKIMNLTIVNQAIHNKKIKDNDMVTISSKAWQTGGSKMFVEAGYQYPVIDLIKGVAIVSGNDAAVALAEHVSGSTDNFVQEMNQKAQKIGMNNTHFVSVNGLGADYQTTYDLSTAKDMTTLARYYITHFPERQKIHMIKTYTTQTRTTSITQNSANPLLDVYPGATGLKTGFINGNYNVIGTAERNHIRLIAVIMGAKSASERASDVTHLLDYGFSQYKSINEGHKGDIVNNVTVFKSKSNKEVDVVLQKDINIVMNVQDKTQVKVHDLYPKGFAVGGMKKGTVIGVRKVFFKDKTYSSNIVLSKSLDKVGFIRGLFENGAMWVTELFDAIFK